MPIPTINRQHDFHTLAEALQTFIDDREDEAHDCWNLGDESGHRAESMVLNDAYNLLQSLDTYDNVFNEFSVETYRKGRS